MSHVVEMTTVALVLGLRHGLDADHLAAIDGLTRSTYSESPGVSRQCGVLFSTGHSTVIALAACVLGLAGRGWTPAPWLEQMGKTVAATVLLVLGIYNLRLALWPTRARTGSPAGPRTAMFRELLTSTRPLQIASVGAVFALSFDTFALAALFAGSARLAGDPALVLWLALAFSLGMIAVDGGNGVWIHHLLGRRDDGARTTAWAMTITVAISSIAIGGAIAASLASESLDRWLETHGVLVSLALVTAMAGGYLAAGILGMPAPNGPARRG